jgi:hypothetical protein
MTAGCITYEELESRANEAREARLETRSVVARSKSTDRVNLGLLIQAAYRTFSLKFKLRILTSRQQTVIEKLVGADFTHCPKEEIRDIGDRIDELVRYERGVLEDSQKLGMVTRFLWNASLAKLGNQVEHLDSISESLHVALDDRTTALMAMALEEVTK